MLAWTTVAAATMGISRWQHWPMAATGALMLLIAGAEIDRLRGRTGPAMLAATAVVLTYWRLFGPQIR
ncbi:MAG: hypothetical protein KF847_13295 [Pirellulales bacterium]|nr:hypothetical protein [Pirellulales bacterium]